MNQRHRQLPLSVGEETQPELPALQLAAEKEGIPYFARPFLGSTALVEASGLQVPAYKYNIYPSLSFSTLKYSLLELGGDPARISLDSQVSVAAGRLPFCFPPGEDQIVWVFFFVVVLVF